MIMHLEMSSKNDSHFFWVPMFQKDHFDSASAIMLHQEVSMESMKKDAIPWSLLSRLFMWISL